MEASFEHMQIFLIFTVTYHEKNFYCHFLKILRIMGRTIYALSSWGKARNELTTYGKRSQVLLGSTKWELGELLCLVNNVIYVYAYMLVKTKVTFVFFLNDE